MDLLEQHPHRRRNPLTGEWVLVSPHRARRPWQGQVESPSASAAVLYDPHCYLCPGNTRANGAVNPAYSSTFVFDNDFAALYGEAPRCEHQPHELLTARGERGVCRVVCFSPDHSLTLSRLAPEPLQRVVETWVEQFAELGAREEIAHVQIFENRGEMMGASNPHPHGQIWASESIPGETAKEEAHQAEYFGRHGRTLLADYAALEERLGERVVMANDGFLAVVPFWAVWPFETLVIARQPRSGFDQLTSAEHQSLAGMLRAVTAKYDALFQTSFPYTMGFHQRPTDGPAYPHVHFHAHFYPPLLRSASVRKFMVGFEMLAEPQRDLTPETAAARLRAIE
jgi:UDPglucose--hexose-1-phosphate uridylyltransferase